MQKSERIEFNNQEALRFNNCGSYSLAINYCNDTLELDPKNDEAYFHRGNAYSNLGKYDKASEDYSKAIEYGPNNTDVYHYRGILIVENFKK